MESITSKYGTDTQVALDWFANQAQADMEDLDVPVGYANAITRDAARRLASLGYDVLIRYPDEEIPGMTLE